MMGDVDKQSAPDEENPEWTEEEMRRARPAREALPEIFGEQAASELLRRGQAGAPKRDVTIPLDEDVLRQMQALGPGWEGKVNEVLREWLEVARGR
jgi:uncharacterized protein (DUF4415 family)